MFRAVSLTKNADIDQYKYPGYGIRFDSKGEFSFGSKGFGRNCKIFGADLSSSSHANNRKNSILVFYSSILLKDETIQQLMQKKCI